MVHESYLKLLSHLPGLVSSARWLPPQVPPIGTLFQYCDFSFLLAVIPIALCPVVERVGVEGTY